MAGDQPDLTRQINRDLLRSWADLASGSRGQTSVDHHYGTITALSESRRKDGLIYVGTDDGLIQVTRTAEIVAEDREYPGLRRPARTGFTCRGSMPPNMMSTRPMLVRQSQARRFQTLHFQKPGQRRTWTSIAGDLPATVRPLACRDHLNPDLLFCGTEFGLYFTIDGARNGSGCAEPADDPGSGSGDPGTRKRPCACHLRPGLYILDDYSPLRQVKTEVLAKDAHLFRRRTRLSRRSIREERDRRGAALDGRKPAAGRRNHLLAEGSLRTKKQERQDAARASERKKEAAKYPSQAS